MDFVRDYMRALLAKEIDAAAELQKQKSQVVYQQYCAAFAFLLSFLGSCSFVTPLISRMYSFTSIR